MRRWKVAVPKVIGGTLLAYPVFLHAQTVYYGDSTDSDPNSGTFDSTIAPISDHNFHATATDAYGNVGVSNFLPSEVSND